jgi:hypothetical protein
MTDADLSFSLDKVVLGEDAEVDEAFWVIQ